LQPHGRNTELRIWNRVRARIYSVFCVPYSAIWVVGILIKQ
jgi:hypothetical protein